MSMNTKKNISIVLLVLALLLGLAAALGWDRPNRPSHPLQPGEAPLSQKG